MKKQIIYILTVAALVCAMVSILCGSALKSAKSTVEAVGTQSREITLPDIETPTENYTEPTEIEYIELIATAYCPCERCCGKWAQNRGSKVVGASGHELISGVSVAVDPAVFPYGTVFEVDDKRYIAHDCGGAIKGNKIDFYFDNHQQAVEFGKQIVKARVIE